MIVIVQDRDTSPTHDAEGVEDDKLRWPTGLAFMNF